MSGKNSEEYKKYFNEIRDKTIEIYNLVNMIKKNSFDPSEKCEVYLANNLAERVEGLLLEYGVRNISQRINELLKETTKEITALKIAEEIIHGKYGELDDEKRAEIALRAALAILTDGITAAPIQGISHVKIKRNSDKTKYLAVYFAGPIRSAGGTEQALTVFIADYIRQLLHLDKYKPNENEVKRYIEEIRLHERYIGRFQYNHNEKLIEKAVKMIPVEVTGPPTTQIEVSINRDLPRVETNKIRGGACRVINDGILGKASKLLKIINELGFREWEWLSEISEGRGEEEPISEKYLEEVIVGRPIFSHPSKVGGFRLRYGRCRNTGLAAIGLNPYTMSILGDFLAVGTQVRLETPGKSGVVMSVDSICGPIVKVTNGSVIKIENQEDIEKIKDKIKEIIFLGDILVSYGDFLENNCKLLPSGYDEEWWQQELILKIKSKFNGEIEKLVLETNISPERLIEIIRGSKPSVEEAINLSMKLDIPLYPLYTYYWKGISPSDIIYLKEWLLERTYNNIADIQEHIVLKCDQRIKKILENLWVPHDFNPNGGEVILNKGVLKILHTCLGDNNDVKKILEAKNGLEAINLISRVRVRDFAPTFVGLRMGRPEKAKERKMKPPVHVLFPVGSEVNNRNIIEAASRKIVNLEVSLRYCSKCGKYTIYHRCDQCFNSTIEVRKCKKCDLKTFNEKCRKCHNNTQLLFIQTFDVYEELKRACINLGIRTPPRIIKGVKKLMNKFRIPEPLEKGILRAKYGVFVYKDGTIRFDVTNAPLTHFKPKEIKTSIEKLNELGYTKDINGNELKDDEQIVELKIHDIIIPIEAAEYLIKVSKFIDDLLVKYYRSKPFYNIKKKEELLGHMIIGLAPHTSCGVIGRIIGFTDAKVCFAHPYWHAAKRRNCDGDEDSISLTLDVFLNFSKIYLPEKTGGFMDAPLVVTLIVDPNEVDDEVFNMEVCEKIPLEFYEKTLVGSDPKEVSLIIEKVKDKLSKSSPYEGLKFTVNTTYIDRGPKISSYKKLKTISEKIFHQLKMAEKVRAVDVKDVVRRVLQHHFIPDLMGNLRAFSTQTSRCVKCNAKYDRPPFLGKCRKCGGKILLTVHKTNIVKYLSFAESLVTKYNLPAYYKQTIDLIKREIQIIFDRSERGRQSKILDYI
ncbi:MAG: DNA polymerase II large subunit [Candidatus Methanomethylicia archaeon]|nr:DNA polymerase II large subunit [Candidatus Methanomethylicia archaeon]